MSEPIKFSQEELDGLGKIQSKYQEKEEETWLNSITTKYGEGSLSLKDGTFIPTKK